MIIYNTTLASYNLILDISSIEKQAGKSVDNMTDEELEAEMKKHGMEVPKDEVSEG